MYTPFYSSHITNFCLAGCDGAQPVTLFFRNYMDVIVELMQDKAAKGHIDFHPKPLNSHHKGEGHRIFAPFRSGLWWQMAHIMSGGKKPIACLIFYSDATEFYKSCGAHPVFGKHFIHDDVCFCWHIILFMAHDYNFLY